MSLAVVQPATTVRRQRLLPIPGQTLVEPGQVVAPDTVVARAEILGAEIPINIANRLLIDPGRIERYLLKHVGEQVVAGEVLAATNGLFGLSGEHVSAPRSGTIESCSRETGVLVIREPSTFVEQRAYLSGKVLEVVAEQGAVVECSAQVFVGAFGVGGERFGRLLAVCDRADMPLEADLIPKTAAGAIILGGAAVTRDCLIQAAKLGVAGIITGSVPSSDLAAYVGYEIGVPITGQENVVTTLIVTAGFGSLPMEQSLHDALRAAAGKTVSINGTTHLRSNLRRPEIIVPVD